MNPGDLIVKDFCQSVKATQGDLFWNSSSYICLNCQQIKLSDKEEKKTVAPFCPLEKLHFRNIILV